MNLKDIIELHPQCADPAYYGYEPNLKQLVEEYYRNFLPESYEKYVEDYLLKLQELIDKKRESSSFQSGDLVKVVFDSKEDTPESFTVEGISIGQTGVVGHIDSSDYPINVLFNDGTEIGFAPEELRKV